MELEELINETAEAVIEFLSIESNDKHINVTYRDGKMDSYSSVISFYECHIDRINKPYLINEIFSTPF